MGRRADTQSQKKKKKMVAEENSIFLETKLGLLKSCKYCLCIHTHHNKKKRRITKSKTGEKERNQIMSPNS